MSGAAERYRDILNEIEAARSGCETAAANVSLITVSKTFGPEDIVPVINAGCRMFGENRVQEAQTKWPALREQAADLELHLIGPLQSNKSADAVALFDVIQTIDREKIALAIGREMEKQGRKLELFVQVNTGSEPQKAGILPERCVEFVDWCRGEAGLAIAGLMAIPPFDENPGPHFALLRQLAEQCGVEQLSMGMSGDYLTAIEFGATHVRVGSAIFGSRN